MKVRGLSGAQLDYWVARAAGWPADALSIQKVPRTSEDICVAHGKDRLAFSTDARQAHELIERELIGTCPVTSSRDTPISGWFGWVGDGKEVFGETLLEAAMRAFVFSKFGEDVPD